MKNSLIISGLVVVSLAAGCAQLTTMKQYDKSIYVSKTTLEKNEIAGIILQVGKDQGWDMHKASLSRIEGSKMSGKEKATVQIKYNRASFEILYVSSENLSYDANNMQIMSTYNNWVSDLRDKIEASLQQQ